MATNVTVKGQVTLPKAVREAAGIRPGDRVNVRVRPEGGVIIKAEAAVKSAEADVNGLKDMSRRRPFRGFSTEEIMRMNSRRGLTFINTNIPDRCGERRSPLAVSFHFLGRSTFS